MTNNIMLGSGKLYIIDYNATTGIPEDAVFETDTNRLGAIKGGATIEYKPTEYEIKDDLNEINKRYVVSEECTFKSGILTWDVATLQKLIAAGTYEDDTTNHTRTLTLGGIGAREMKKYALRFVHTEGNGHKFRMTMVATASAGLSLAFSGEAETTIDAEFKAISYGSDAAQIILEETYPATTGGGNL